MEENKEGIEQALTDLAENYCPPGVECMNFARLFGEHLKTIKQQRAQGYVAGRIPVEVERPSLLPVDIIDLKADFEMGRLSLPQGGKSRLLSFIRIDQSSGQMSLEITEYGPQKTEDNTKIEAGFRAMIKAVRFFNSSATNREKFPRIYEYIKAFTHYLRGETGSAPDMAKIGEFLATVHLEAPDSLSDEVYRLALRQPKIQTMLKFIIKDGSVNESNFRQWLNDFHSDNKGYMSWIDHLKKNVATIMREEFLKRFLGEFEAGFPKRSEGPFLTAPSLRPGSLEAAALPLKRLAEGPMPILNIIRSDVASETAEVSAGASKDKSEAASGDAPGRSAPRAEEIKPMKIIDIGEARQEAPGEAELARLAAPLFKYMAEQKAKGAKFGNVHMLIICDMLFGSSIKWVENGEINFNVTADIGLQSAFKDHPRGADEDVFLVDHLFNLKIEMIKKGLLNSAVREQTRRNFVVAISRINKK